MLIIRSFIRALGCLTLAILACGAPSRVRAQARDDSPDRSENPAAASAEAGMFLPNTIAPRTDSQHGFLVAFGGYDSAKDSAQSEALLDVSIVSWLAARVGVLYAQTPDQFRPTMGLRAQALKQENAGIDLGFGAY